MESYVVTHGLVDNMLSIELRENVFNDNFPAWTSS